MPYDFNQWNLKTKQNKKQTNKKTLRNKQNKMENKCIGTDNRLVVTTGDGG